MVTRNDNAFPSGNMGRQDQGDDETLPRGSIPHFEQEDHNMDDMNIHSSFPRPQHPNGKNADGYTQS